MAYNHYAELVVADSTTGRPLANQVVKLLDFETGAEVDAYRDEVATLLVSGANGLVLPFQTLDTTRRVKMIIGDVTYSRWCDEMIERSEDRGRATAALYGSADNIVDNGTYGILLSEDATALGLPVAASGDLEVYNNTNILYQRYWALEGATWQVYARRRYSGTWSAWEAPFKTARWEATGAFTGAPADLDSLPSGIRHVYSGASATDLGLPVSAGGAIRTVYVTTTAGTQDFVPFAGGITWRRTRGSNGWSGWTMMGGSKLVPVALTTSGGTSITTATAVHGRVPLKLAVRGSRFRVHFRNFNYRLQTAYSGSLSFLGAAFGKAAKTDGQMTGQFAEAPSVIMSASTTPSGGTEWVSPWITKTIEPHTDYLISYAYTSPTDQQNFASVGGGWQSTDTTLWDDQTDAALAKTGKLPLDIWIEVDVPASTPVIAYVGDSLTAGVSAYLPVYDSYPNRHALAHGAVPINYGFSGDGMNGYTSSGQPKLTKWSAAFLAKPDALVWSLGSNDIFAGATEADLRARLNTALPLVTAVTCSNVYFTTILPRYASSSAYEPMRKTWNNILQTELPWNGVMCFDAAATCTDSSGDLIDVKWAASGTDFHLNKAGYARFAASIPSLAS